MIATEDAALEYVAGLCDGPALDRLRVLVSELIAENERQNLVSRGTLRSVWQRHVADSAQLIPLVPGETPRWLDLGTGAGFPGLVVSVMRPEWSVTLVESRKKRAEWLERTRAKLGLRSCRIVGQRLEVVSALEAGVISARAFAPLPQTLQLARRFSTSDTLWLLPKGRSAEQELDGMTEQVRSMFHVERSLTDGEAKILVGRGRPPA